MSGATTNKRWVRSRTVSVMTSMCHSQQRQFPDILWKLLEFKVAQPTTKQQQENREKNLFEDLMVIKWHSGEKL